MQNEAENGCTDLTECENPPTWSKSYVEKIISDFTDTPGPSDCITKLENPQPINIFKEIFPEKLINTHSFSD